MESRRDWEVEEDIWKRRLLQKEKIQGMYAYLKEMKFLDGE